MFFRVHPGLCSGGDSVEIHEYERRRQMRLSQHIDAFLCGYARTGLRIFIFIRKIRRKV